MASIVAPARGSRPTVAPVRIRGWCKFDVIGNAFQFRWDATTWVDATIASDGTITGGAERITLVGKQTGPKIDGDVTNGNCGLHFTVTKAP